MFLLLALLLQRTDSLPPKPPAAPPAAWLALIGAYASGGDTFYVFEDRGALAVFVKLSPATRLAQVPESVFTLHRLAMGPADGGLRTRIPDAVPCDASQTRGRARAHAGGRSLAARRAGP